MGSSPPESESPPRRSRVRMVPVDERGDGQRVDNFVLRECPDVPKTRIYRALRKGEIRVNGGRVRPQHRLVLGDEVRLPPLNTGAPRSAGTAPAGWQARLEDSIVHEDDQLLVINKPSGLAVHGGSGLQFGLIETLRSMRPQDRFLELVHRLDRDTSGLILVARKPAALRALHDLLRGEKGVEKRYVALVAGRWPRHQRLVEAPLQRVERRSGERIVRVHKDGKASRTAFAVRNTYPGCTLIEAQPLTGRTHQIRVHAMHVGHPLLGDDKYADEAARTLTSELGLKRLFLHAEGLRFKLGDQLYELHAPLDPELTRILERASN